MDATLKDEKERPKLLDLIGAKHHPVDDGDV